MEKEKVTEKVWRESWLSHVKVLYQIGFSVDYKTYESDLKPLVEKLEELVKTVKVNL